MTKTLNISHSYNRRRYTTTERFLCFQADRLEKWIKTEKRMDSTCSMTVTSSSVLGSHKSQVFHRTSQLFTKYLQNQKLPQCSSSMMCQGRHTCSPHRKSLLCRATQWEAINPMGIAHIHSFSSERGKAEFNLTVPQVCLKMLYQRT